MIPLYIGLFLAGLPPPEVSLMLTSIRCEQRRFCIQQYPMIRHHLVPAKGLLIYVSRPFLFYPTEQRGEHNEPGSTS